MNSNYLTTVGSTDFTNIITEEDEIYSPLSENLSKLLYMPDSIFRPLRKSEFKNILRQRMWNKDMCIVVKTLDDGITQFHASTYSQSYYPSGDIDMFSSSELSSLDFPITGTDSRTNEDKIREIYRKTLGTLEPKSDFLDPTEEARLEEYTEIEKLLSNLSIQNIEVLSERSYVDQVDLGGWIKRASGHSIQADVEVEILYSIDGGIYQNSTIIPLFYYTRAGQLNQETYVLDIDGNVQLDLVDGVLKVSPLSNKVDEYIINKCKLIYGRIK